MFLTPLTGSLFQAWVRESCLSLAGCNFPAETTKHRFSQTRDVFAFYELVMETTLLEYGASGDEKAQSEAFTTATVMHI